MDHKCCLHPGRKSVDNIYSQFYCDPCVKGIAAARLAVDRHVEPKDCFIWYVGAPGWRPIDGTGCAHWVAHQLDIKNGREGDKCLAGFTYRVSVLVQGKRKVVDTLNKVGKLTDVQINDIYVMPAMNHTGLVFKIETDDKGDPTIWIRHDSSGQGKLAENKLSFFAKGNGSFYR